MLRNTRFISCVELCWTCAHSWDIMFNTLYLLTTLNISIQTMDIAIICNSYVLRILCFGERVIGWVRGGGRGTKHFISFEGGIKYFPTLLGGVPNFMVKFWNALAPPPPSTHTLWPVPNVKINHKRFAKRFKMFLKLNCLLSVNIEFQNWNKLISNSCHENNFTLQVRFISRATTGSLRLA